MYEVDSFSPRFQGDKPLETSPHTKLESKYNKKDDETTLTLTVDSVTPEDAGVYRCVATNVVGEATTECRLTIERE